MIELIWNIFIYTNLGATLAVALVVMTIAWMVAYKLDRYDLADVAWPVAFFCMALTTFFMQRPAGIMDTQQPFVGVTPRTIVTLLVLVWAIRLGYYLFRRWRSSPEEDYRYRELRGKWGARDAIGSYMGVFLLQGILAWIVMFPVTMINFIDAKADVFLWVGVTVWLVGFVFQVLGDRQLERFKAATKGKRKLLTTGLWQYTRHPNYFGEVTMWWGIFIVGITSYWTSSILLSIAMMGPLLITYLIVRVSGIPLSEKHLEGRPGWKEYKKQTSMFMPFLPRR